MSDKRLNRLLNFYDQNPDDTFTIFALAKEYQKQAQYERSALLFDRLINDFPHYSGSYYHYIQILLDMKKWSKAKNIYLKGLENIDPDKDSKDFNELKQSFETYFDDL